MNTNLKVRYNLLACESKVLQKLLLIYGIFFASCFIVSMFPIFNATHGKYCWNNFIRNMVCLFLTNLYIRI
jgi:hypothetical protein